jgi:hypothetical protein
VTILICFSLSSSVENSQNLGWVKCADKAGDECKFYGHKLLRFGENGNYIYKVGSNKVKCDADYFRPDKIDTKTNTCDFYNGDIVWRQCASDGMRCEFTGTKFFRYGGGANHNGVGYVFRQLTDGALCSSSVFNDPNVGTNKFCYYGEEFDPSKFYWKVCAYQDGTCKFNGNQIVRYGSNHGWNYFYAKDTTTCNHMSLGDPLSGVYKRCEYQAINEDSCPNDAFLNGKQCVSKCPEGTLVSLDNKTCLSKCESNQVYFSGTQKCVQECPNGYYIKGQECIQCEAGTYTSLDQSSCLSKCPQDQFLIKAAKRCYGYCPSQYKVIVNTNECIFDCTEANLSVTADSNYCADPCPDGQFKYGAECFYECPFGFFINKKDCVVSCPEGSFRSADNRACLTECREGEFASRVDKKCYSRCPTDQFGSGKECVSTCPTGTFKSFDGLLCLEKCPKEHFAYKPNASCYSNCPGNTYVSESECVDACPAGTVLSADRRNCLTACPKNQYLVAAYNSCFYSCPYNQVANSNTCTLQK